MTHGGELDLVMLVIANFSNVWFNHARHGSHNTSLHTHN